MDEEHRQLELRIYARRVTWGIVFVGGLIFTLGLRFSGIDLEELEGRSRVFKPDQHVCLRTGWLETTAGDRDRVQFCVEWLDLSDTSGRTHEMVQKDLEIIKDSNGMIHTQLKRRLNYTVIGTILFLVVLMAIGKATQRYLIEKKRIQLGVASTTKE